jgi:hypothetical protein
LDKKTNRVVDGHRRFRSLEQVIGVQTIPDREVTRISLLLTNGESFPIKGTVIGTPEESVPLAQEMAKFLGVPWRPAAPRLKRLLVEQADGRLIIADTTARGWFLLYLLKPVLILAFLGLQWEVSRRFVVATIFDGPWWLCVPFGLALIGISVALLVVARRIPRRVRQVIRGGDVFTLDLSADCLMRGEKTLAKLGAVRNVCLEHRGLTNDQGTPEQAALMLELDNRAFVQVGEAQSDYPAMQHLANVVAAYLGKSVQLTKRRRGRWQLGGVDVN